MSRAVAPGPGAEQLVAGSRPGDGGRGRRAARMPGRPARLRIPPWVVYAKDDVFGLCDVLDRAGRVLTAAGQPDEAARVAAAFELLEAGLT